MKNAIALEYMQKNHSYGLLALISKLPQSIRTGSNNYKYGRSDSFSRTCAAFYQKWRRARSPSRRTSIKDKKRANLWNKKNREWYNANKSRSRWRHLLDQAIRYGNQKRVQQCKGKLSYYDNLRLELAK